MLTRDPIPWLKQQLGPSIHELSMGGHRPLVLDDPSSAYLTLSDNHHLFCVGRHEGRLEGRREHVAECPRAQLILGIDPGKHAGALLLSGGRGDVIWQFPAARLWALRGSSEDRALVEELFEGFVELLALALPTAPCPDTGAEKTPIACAETGRFVWVQTTRAIAYCGNSLSAPSRPITHWPLFGTRWLACGGEGYELRSSAELLAADGSGSFASEFCAFALELVIRNRGALQREREDREAESRAGESRQLTQALGQLAALGAESVAPDRTLSGDPFERTLRAISSELGASLPRRVPLPRSNSPQHVRIALGRLDTLRARSVLLEGPLWRDDAGPLLAFWSEAGERSQPVALLPRRGGYALYDPRDSSTRALDATVLAQLHPRAHQFYRALPPQLHSLRELLRFASSGIGRDLRRVAWLGLTIGLIGTAVPILTGQLYDRIIPGAERGLLAQLLWTLLGVYAGTFLFDVARNLALLGVQTRIDGTLQAAVWDRTLRLPLGFFRQFSAGDLAARANGVGAIREVMSHVVLSSVLAGVFSFWHIGVLLYFDRGLSALALLLLLAAASFAALISRRQLKQRRQVVALDGRLNGLLVQIFGGISKLRVSASENRVLSVWASLFTRRAQAAIRGEQLGVQQAVFQAAFPLCCNLALCWLLTREDRRALSTGGFLAFNASFGLLLRAVFELIRAGSEALRALPHYERAQPILSSPLENQGRQGAFIELQGAIELIHVSFRYDHDSARVVDDVSLRIEPGEFVAIVGASGSGKSTLLRLLLGFEAPEEGAVFYDGQALSGLDVRDLRRQIGVVTQLSQVREGDILSNIIGSSGLGLEGAWHAARLAAFDRDIEAMPMGIYTVLAAGGAALSAGQRQRLLLARALASQPKILLLDEATSALDNETQARVRESLDALRVTRVVVAHRLSTIRRADKIVVIEQGRIVEVGRYETLLEQDRSFAALARRQLL